MRCSKSATKKSYNLKLCSTFQVKSNLLPPYPSYFSTPVKIEILIVSVQIDRFYKFEIIKNQWSAGKPNSIFSCLVFQIEYNGPLLECGITGTVKRELGHLLLAGFLRNALVYQKKACVFSNKRGYLPMKSFLIAPRNNEFSSVRVWKLFRFDTWSLNQDQINNQMKYSNSVTSPPPQKISIR